MRGNFNKFVKLSSGVMRDLESANATQEDFDRELNVYFSKNGSVQMTNQRTEKTIPLLKVKLRPTKRNMSMQ